MERRLKYLSILLLIVVAAVRVSAQERVGPLMFNGAVANNHHSTTAQQKTTALSLPFFEDFTDYSTWPNANRWADAEVYINNTMCVSPISRGVATFDALDAHGIPYDPYNRTSLLYADSLTSNPIDLFPYFPSDSLYISFFYQPAGNGFAPEEQDSLMLYFKKSNEGWVKVWSQSGNPLDSFKQVMVPIKDTAYLHATFQFRFVNKASINTSDDVWNVDYIRLDEHRTFDDTLINDVTMADEPSFILKDYTSMPYRQFLANPSQELATQHFATIRNNYNEPANITYNYSATEHFTQTPLATGTPASTLIVSNTKELETFPVYTNNVTSTQYYDNFTFDTKYYVQSQNSTDNRINDTIVKQQIFYNYLAYDDGTAEQSYYLNLFPTLPGKTAIEFHLNNPDTIAGVAIYFGRQVPIAYDKYFSVFVYNKLGENGAADDVAYQEDFLLSPSYLRNDFYWVYQFSKPVPMPAGTFYIGTEQPALSNSDSLYLGLDVNRKTDNHLFFNVIGSWQASNVSGAVMIRPMLGYAYNEDASVSTPGARVNTWSAYPNPTHDRLRVNYSSAKPADYWLTDMQGRMIQSGEVHDGDYVDVNNLTPGVYFMRLRIDNIQTSPQKIVKY